MQDLKITLIQSDLHWEDVDANLSMFEEKIWRIGRSTDNCLAGDVYHRFHYVCPKVRGTHEHENIQMDEADG